MQTSNKGRFRSPYLIAIVILGAVVKPSRDDFVTLFLNYSRVAQIFAHAEATNDAAR